MTSQAIGTEHPDFPHGRQVIEGDNGRRGSGESVDQGPPPSHTKLEEDAGVVPRRGGSHPAARLSHTRADHGGA